ncbi:cell surface protein [Hyphomonas sp. WL0036]|uniref:cell surface protein n=1 Tax=Hyphomonas sediminis TaxID=2866160 RepID=UPI001C806B95|nr:cell surface protein [Hyphomonas sediminis]MBY9065787.1 cell surface protein [Hyphomonas sediminis]
MSKMAQTASPSALQYLDKAMGGLKQLGLVPDEGKNSAAPIVALLEQIADLEPEKVAAIARTLDQASLFNDVVREQVSGITVGERYEGVTTAFNTIRDDAKSLVDQYADGKISTMERVSNVWMKMTRGDIASRFGKIKDLYLEVQDETANQIDRERKILEAYLDFRGAMKQSEVLALEVLKTAEGELEAARLKVGEAVTTVAGYSGEDPAERARLELARDEQLRLLQAEEKRYQVSKDLSDNITIGYNTSEVIMARLVQTTSAKERVYAQSVSFFSTNEVVLTALTASFTGMHGLHESTQTLEAMKKGVNQSLEVLAEIGGQIQEAAVKAGYGPTVSAASVKMLVDSVVSYQERTQTIIAEMRVLATENSKEIREAVEDGKRRLTKLVEEGAALALLPKP